MAGHGTEQGLMQHLSEVMDAVEGHGVFPPPVPVAADPHDFGGGTPNHKGLRAACRYVDAVLLRQPFKVSEAQAAGHASIGLLAFLDEQRRVGHQRIGGACELFTASHGQLWAALAAVPLWAAVKVGDAEVAAALAAWWHDHFALCELVLLPVPRVQKAPLVWGPGARAFIGGKKLNKVPIAWNPARDLCYRLIYGLPTPSPKRDLWRGKDYLGPRALAAIDPAVRSVLRRPDGYLPAVPVALHVARFAGGGDFAAWFDGGGGMLEPALSAGVEAGVPWISEGVDEARLERYAKRRDQESLVDLPAKAA